VERVLCSAVVDTKLLAGVSFTGVRARERSAVWALLSGLWSPWHGSRPRLVADAHSRYLYGTKAALGVLTHADLDRIAADVVRTVPVSEVFDGPPLADALARILAHWVSSVSDGEYVQGISDIAGIMLGHVLVARSPRHIISPPDDHDDGDGDNDDNDGDGDGDNGFVESDAWWEGVKSLGREIPEHELMAVEAETCEYLQALLLDSDLGGLYAPGQPRVMELLDMLDRILRVELKQVWSVLETLSLRPPLYAYRWIACLLARELEPQAVGLVWDALFAYRMLDPDRVGSLLVACCVELIRMFGASLLLPGTTFESAVSLLQHLPIRSWSRSDVQSFLKRAAAAESIRFANAEHYLP